MGTYTVQKVTVVRDDDHGAVAGHQNVFQPADGVDVQVVGGLIQQQYVRVRKQRLCQQHTQFPARRQSTHGAVVLLQRNIQAQQQLTGSGFRGVAIHFGKLHFQVCHGHTVFLTHLWQRINAVPLFFHIPEFFVAHNHSVHH